MVLPAYSRPAIASAENGSSAENGLSVVRGLAFELGVQAVARKQVADPPPEAPLDTAIPAELLCGRPNRSTNTAIPAIVGTAVELQIVSTAQGSIMRAEHSVREFLEQAHQQLGEIVRSGSGVRAPIGFANKAQPEVDISKLEGLVNCAGLFLDVHAVARADGFGPSLLVREISSEGLKIFEHLRLELITLNVDGQVSEGCRQPLLGYLVEVRGSLRGLLQHFDSGMLQFTATAQAHSDDAPEAGMRAR